MSVLGQPSVEYLRRSQPPSRYQPSRPCSAIFASTSSSEYGLSFSLVTMGDPSFTPLHHNATVDVDRLPGDERRLGRGEPQRRRRDVRRRPPARHWRRVRDGAPELLVRRLAEGGLDPARAQDVHPHLRGERAGEALAVGEDPALDRAEQLGIRAGHAARHVVPAHVEDGAAVRLPAHDGARGGRARDRALEVHGQQQVELALPVPLRRVAREHVGGRVVDPHVELAEALARLGDERLAARAGAQVGARDDRAAAALRDAFRDAAGGALAAAIGHEHRRAGARESLGDGGADAGARAGDDGARAVEPARARLRRPVRRPVYPSAPPANGCRAWAWLSATCCAVGSPPIARAIDSVVAWRLQSKIFLSSLASQWMKTPTMMHRSSTWSAGMMPSRTASTTPRATPACAGPNICTAWVAPLIVTLLAMIVSGLAGRLGATTASRLVWPSFWLISASANASPTGPSLRPISRSMCATSLPSPTRDSPTMNAPAIRALLARRRRPAAAARDGFGARGKL